MRRDGISRSGLVLRIEDLTIEASDRTSLRGISFEVREHEVVAVVGEAASGKSLLCYAIMGLLPLGSYHQRGAVHLGDIDLTALRQKDLRKLRGPAIAMIVPGGRSALNPVERVGAQLLDVLRSHFPEMSKTEMIDRAETTLTSVGIPDPRVILRLYPSELSGGMAQRILIAKALVCRPNLLVGDEFTGGLDVTIQAQVLDEMLLAVRETGSSVLLTTSDLGVAANYATKVGVLRGGQLVEFASVEQFFASPIDPYSKRLLDAARLAHRFTTAYQGTSSGEIDAAQERGASPPHPPADEAHRRMDHPPHINQKALE